MASWFVSRLKLTDNVCILSLMDNLPSGTVTFLFTDIEGSTKLAQGHPDKWEALQQRHHAILQSTIDEHNGFVFQIIGDAFCAAFHTAIDGLSTAIDAQRKLQTENWDGTPVKVRMGLHTGSAELIGNEYHGYITLARAQRVMSVAYGGQILLSNASAELIHNELPEGITLRDMKEHRLKGLLNPERLWQIVAPDLQQDFPPLQSFNEIPNNLPVQLTSFVGRENEIAELKQELEAHRLVTLTGSGGTGKTRLSLQVAAELLEKFDHGVWFIELAPLIDPDLIPQTILSVIGISEQPNKTPLEILKEYLHEKKALIVLDNCEHLVSASAKVANILLNAAPNLKILASSREALGVKGELSYPVPSLSLPDVKHLPTIEQLSQYEAVRLFIDRALLVSPHFVVDKDNAPFIAQICYRLDGIPLAIELAAARIKMLSVEQISKRLDDRFRLLTGGARTALPRQQTLRALIDWSYDILTEKERLLLRRLSTFAGGWTLEATEEVCAGDSIEAFDVLDLLTQLVNKSLVIVMEHSQSGETRYRMLETIRQYAREKLLEVGGSESIRDKHLAYFVKLVEQAEPELYRSNQVFWLNKLDDELDNLRMAMEWALTASVQSGLQIASIPWRFWNARGYPTELGDWFKQLLERHFTTDILHARALAIYSIWHFQRGNFSETLQFAEQSLQMARTLSDRQTEAFSLNFLGAFILLQGNVREGMTLLEQGLAIYRTLGDKIGQADTLRFMAVHRGLSESRIDLSEEAIRLYRELGDLYGVTVSLIELARLTMWEGDFFSPAPMLEEAIMTSRQLGSQTSEEEALLTYGTLAYWRGNYEGAVALYEEAIGISEKIGDHYQNLWGRVHEAYAVLCQGDLQKARALFENNIINTSKAGLTIALVYTIEGLASLHVNQNQPERATRLFAWADMMREKIGDHRPPVEQGSVEKDLAIIHSKVNDDEFEKLSSNGRTMTVEQAIALALEV